MSHFHVHVKEEEWEVICRLVHDGKERDVFSIIVHGHSLEIEVCKRNVRSGTRPHSRISRSEASFLFEFFLLFFVKAAKKLVVEPPMTVDLSLMPLLTDFSLSHRDNPTSRHGVLKKVKHQQKRNIRRFLTN